MIIHDNVHFYVITGGPGAGKTTLINALRHKGFLCVDEDARNIIQEQLKYGGDALPWMDKEKYTGLMLEKSVETYRKTRMSHPSQFVFFDRGIPDTLCYANMTGQTVTAEMKKYVNDLRYNKTVFILPPWPEIYKTDNERKQNWDEAVFTYNEMKKTYRQFNYDTVEVPPDSVENRITFVLNHISQIPK